MASFFQFFPLLIGEKGMARQLFLISQTPMVVQVRFFSDSEQVVDRAEVILYKSVHSSSPMPAHPIAEYTDTPADRNFIESNCLFPLAS